MALKITIAVLGLVAVAGAAIFWLGSRLPVRHRAVAELTLRQTPDAIYAIVSDVVHASSWRHDVKACEFVEPAADGAPRFREETKNGSITYRIESAETRERFVTRIDDPGLPFAGTWTITITPDGDASNVRITEDGDVYPILFRFMSHYVFGYYGTMQSYLSALAERFGEKASIRIIPG